MSQKVYRSKVKKLDPTIIEDGGDFVEFFLSAPSKFRLFFSIIIKGNDLEVFFDSGSGLSTISSFMVNFLKLDLTEDSSKTIRLINGGLMLLNKSTVVNIEYKDIVISHRLYLLDESNENIILGMDFFEKVSLFPYDKELRDLGNEVNTYNEREFGKTGRDVTMVDVEQLDLGAIVELKCQSNLVPNKADRQLIARVMNNRMPNGVNMNIHLLGTRNYKVMLPTKINIYNEPIDSPISMFYMGIQNEKDGFKFHIGTEDCNEIAKIESILRSYKHLFAFKSSDLKRAKGVLHKIDTGDSIPIKQRNYRYGYKEREEISKQVKDMLDGGIITENSSSWINPIVLVKQHNKY